MELKKEIESMLKTRLKTLQNELNTLVYEKLREWRKLRGSNSSNFDRNTENLETFSRNLS